MEYVPKDIEDKSKEKWNQANAYKAVNPSDKEFSQQEKYYVLDMFPYPSGAGLHVGHPLGYIASDIYARYQRHLGKNVLHPMGFDAFGLPAEQYAIQTGQHPCITTEKNIARYIEQLNKIGLSYDWNRTLKTCDASYYKWTQWIFIQLFNTWYNKKSNKAEPINTLIQHFEQSGNINIQAESNIKQLFTAKDWQGFSEKEKSDILMCYRLAYHSEAYVNWCAVLGTVLANDEVKDGVSERGGYPVERKLMPQWSLRITAYADRLLNGLETVNWSESIKEAQRNWIGKSEGAEIEFVVKNQTEKIKVFTTRPDTIFGISYLVLAPEHPIVNAITNAEQKTQVDAYVQYAKNRSERERQADVNKVTGQFTGSYAIHPLTKQEIPIWIADYVLYHYGTGAVMAVPAHDSRDFKFAKIFGLPIKQVIQPPIEWDFLQQSYDEKNGTCINSEFINGLPTKTAIQKVIEEIEKRGYGKCVTNYKLRDAVFGRQRYWGEPIPIFYDENNIPHTVDETDLPITLPDIDKYLPTETGEPPLARAKNWKYKNQYEYENTTMPGWAGSSWYFLRYMDPQNNKVFADKINLDYWNQVDLYVGGSEHATGHLLYARFWTMFLYDLGYLNFQEPFKKLINQGMILGNSAFVKVVTIDGIANIFYISDDADEDIAKKIIQDTINRTLRAQHNKNIDEITIERIGFAYRHRPIDYVDDNNFIAITAVGDIENKPIKHLPSDFNKAQTINIDYNNSYYYISEKENKFLCHREVEKMSKSKFNVVNPDDIIEKYGADTFRMFEMFLGPIEMHKPFITSGITGVYNFLRKFFRLYFNEEGVFYLSNEKPNEEELKLLHRSIKKIRDDIERFSFNTGVSNFMILVNKLQELKCNKKEILEPIIILISPFAPFTAEYLWSLTGHNQCVVHQPYPHYNAEYLVDNSFNYPVSFNGKTRFNIELPLNMPKEQVEQIVLANEQTKKYLNNSNPKKIIFVEKKIINIVL